MRLSEVVASDHGRLNVGRPRPDDRRGAGHVRAPRLFQREDALISQAIEDIRFIEAAIEMYRTNEGTLPETLDLVESANLLDPWNRPYQYLKIEGKTGGELKGKYRHFMAQVPVNLDFDLYSMGKDGKSPPALTAEPSRDDIIRLDKGTYVGTITMY